MCNRNSLNFSTLRNSFRKDEDTKQTIGGELLALHCISTSLIMESWASGSVIASNVIHKHCLTWLIAALVLPAAQQGSGCDSSKPYKLYSLEARVEGSLLLITSPRSLPPPWLVESNPTPLRLMPLWPHCLCHCQLSLDHSPLFIKSFGTRCTAFSLF